MKRQYLVFIFRILTAFITTVSYAQTAKITGSVTNRDATTENAQWTIFIKQSGTVIKVTANDTKGHFMFTGIATGYYSLIFESIGYRTIIIENLQITHDTTINIKYPDSCAVTYTTYLKKGKPVCPVGNHTKSIIPIVYGFPLAKTMRKAKKGLVRLGGCELMGCDPHYYCTLHNREL